MNICGCFNDFVWGMDRFFPICTYPPLPITAKANPLSHSFLMSSKRKYQSTARRLYLIVVWWFCPRIGIILLLVYAYLVVLDYEIGIFRCCTLQLRAVYCYYSQYFYKSSERQFFDSTHLLYVYLDCDAHVLPFTPRGTITNVVLPSPTTLLIGSRSTTTFVCSSFMADPSTLQLAGIVCNLENIPLYRLPTTVIHSQCCSYPTGLFMLPAPRFEGCGNIETEYKKKPHADFISVLLEIVAAWSRKDISCIESTIFSSQWIAVGLSTLDCRLC